MCEHVRLAVKAAYCVNNTTEESTMISAETLADFASSTSVVMSERDHALAKEFSKIAAKAAAAGAYHSGRTLILMMEAAAEDFGIRANSYLSEAVNAIKAHELQLRTEGADLVFTLVTAEVLLARDHVRSVLMSHKKFQLTPLGRGPNDAAIASIRQRYDEATLVTVQKLEIEARRGLVQMTRSAPDNTNVTQNFYGHVGAVISGDQNTTEVNMAFNAEGVAALSSALSVVIEKLSAYQSASGALQEEIIELIELAKDAKAEADKPKPNKLKLISAVQGVGAAVGLIKNLPGAYEVLKIAAVQIGIPLP
jgi:hypothetical protein